VTAAANHALHLTAARILVFRGMLSLQRAAAGERNRSSLRKTARGALRVWRQREVVVTFRLQSLLGTKRDPER